MQQPTLYLLIGYPGAGKTTVADYICEAAGATHLWADYERQKMFVRPTHSAKESRQLYQYLNELTDKLLSEGRSVVFDTNFNFRKDREHLRSIATSRGAETVVVWITTPKEIAKQRAVEESANKDTRLYGNMSTEDFERIAGHLQPPQDAEQAIKIDGTDTDKATALKLLGLGA